MLQYLDTRFLFVLRVTLNPHRGDATEPCVFGELYRTGINQQMTFWSASRASRRPSSLCDWMYRVGHWMSLFLQYDFCQCSCLCTSLECWVGGRPFRHLAICCCCQGRCVMFGFPRWKGELPGSHGMVAVQLSIVDRL